MKIGKFELNVYSDDYKGWPYIFRIQHDNMWQVEYYGFWRAWCLYVLGLEIQLVQLMPSKKERRAIGAA